MDNHYKCSYENCSFDIFLNTQNFASKYYPKENDGYCIFHQDPSDLENPTKNDRLLLKESTEEYFDFCYKYDLDINFSDASLGQFKIPSQERKYKKITFKDTFFTEYADFDNLKCEELIIEDCYFEEGARFKEIQINHLTFKPKKVNNAVVFETGGYVDKDGLIAKRESFLHNIDKFSNHTSGNGHIVFVGMNFKRANFKNTILDNVHFQNCNLENVLLLNSNVNKTRFTNCEFAQRLGRKYFFEIMGQPWKVIMPIVPLLALPLFSFILMDFDQKLLTLVVSPFVIFIIIMFLSSLGGFMNFIFYFISKLENPKNEKSFSSLSAKKVSDYHLSTADEEIIYKNLDSFISKGYDLEKKDTLEKSLEALSDLYGQLKENFEAKKDTQTSGEFFYAKRYVELLANKKGYLELFILQFHYAVNGFGERFLRPILLFVVVLFGFSFLYTPNQDMVSTQATPDFLLGTDKSDSSVSDVIYTDLNKTRQYYIDRTRQYNMNKTMYIFNKKIEKEADFYVIKLNEKASFYFSLSSMTHFFTHESKSWFEVRNEITSTLKYIEGILLWFFTGAFFLALRNRIRR